MKGGEQDLRSKGGRGPSVHLCLRLLSPSPPDNAAIETPGSQPYSVTIRAKGELFSVSPATHDSLEGLGALPGERTHWSSQGAGSLRHSNQLPSGVREPVRGHRTSVLSWAGPLTLGHACPTALWSPGSPAPFTKPLTWVLSALAQGRLSVSQSTLLLCVLLWPAGPRQPFCSPVLPAPPASAGCPTPDPRLVSQLTFPTASRVSHISAIPAGLPLHSASHDLSAEPDPEKTALTVASQPEICRHTLAALDPVHSLYPAQLLGLGFCRCPAWPLAPAAGLTRLQS